MDTLRQFAPHQIALGIGGCPDVGHLLQYIVAYAVFVNRHRCLFLPHLLLAQVIEAQVEFFTNPSGAVTSLVIHQGGQDVKAVRQ